MSIWQFIKKYLQPNSGQKEKRNYSYVAALQEQHKQKRRASDSQLEDLPQILNQDERHQLWIRLSPREQDVTALTCLKYTNRQIAARLGISVETVRTYLVNVLNKLGLETKADLRVFFAGWDFDEWERRSPYR
jgi:DNA-binding CsgD family transcriptional regulator